MRRVAWLAAAVIVPRLAVFPFTQNLFGDAIARTWLAHRWLEAPHLLGSFDDGTFQFGPLHIVLLALAEWVWPSLLHAGRALSLVLGALTAWPLYDFTARRWGAQAATVSVLAFSAWGVHVQASTTSASEALGLFLVMGTVALFDRAATSRAALLGAALMLTLACATRYDAWLWVPLLVVAQAWRSRRPMDSALFGAAAGAFPLAWSVGNWLAKGDPLYPFRFIDAFHKAWWPGEAAQWGEMTYRLMCLGFWPGVAVVTVGPVVAVLGGLGLVRAWRTQPDLRWLVLLIAVPTALYTARAAVFASFAPLARFTLKEVLLLLPFVATGGSWRWWAPGVATTAAISLALCVVCFTPDEGWKVTLRAVSPVTRLEPRLAEVAALLAREAPAGGLLVVDEDPRAYDDLLVATFSEFPYERQLRRRWARYDEALGARAPDWLVLFDGGRMERTGEVTALDAQAVAYRTARYRLHASRFVRVYRRAP